MQILVQSWVTRVHMYTKKQIKNKLKQIKNVPYMKKTTILYTVESLNIFNKMLSVMFESSKQSSEMLFVNVSAI